MGKFSYSVMAERIVPEYHGIVTADSDVEAAQLTHDRLSKDGSKFKKITLTLLQSAPAEDYEWAPGYGPLGIVLLRKQ